MNKIINKIIFYTLLGLALGLSSCSKDDGGGELCQVTACIQVNTNTTNAHVSKASVTIPTGFQLRQIIEVWNTEGTLRLIRKTSTTTDPSALVADMRLPVGTYDFLIWVDFVPLSSTADYRYLTDNSDQGLHNVMLNLDDNNQYKYAAGTYADAFDCALLAVPITGSFNLQATVTRHLGCLNIYSSTTISQAQPVAVTYTPALCNCYNVRTQIASATSEVKPLYSNTGDNTSVVATDYLFTSSTAEETIYKGTITVGNTVKEYIMPIKCNSQTNLTGTF